MTHEEGQTDKVTKEDVMKRAIKDMLLHSLDIMIQTTNVKKDHPVYYVVRGLMEDLVDGRVGIIQDEDITDLQLHVLNFIHILMINVVGSVESAIEIIKENGPVNSDHEDVPDKPTLH